MFTGLATYSQNIFPDSIAEDVSPEIGLISPTETPLLSLLGDSDFSAKNKLHEWLEDALTPTAIVATSALTALSGSDTFNVASTAQMQVGQILTADYNEYMKVASFPSPTSVMVVRGFGGTTLAAVAAATTLQIVSEAALEGAAVTRDLSVGRLRKKNYLQMFKRDVILSNTVRAMNMLGGVTDDFALQRTYRLRELLIQLERTILVGIWNAVTVEGSSTEERTLQGIRSALTTNVYAPGNVALDASKLDAAIKLAWDKGATDVSLLLTSSKHQEDIDALNNSRVRVVNEENKFRNAVRDYEGTYGSQRTMINRWMPPSETFALAPRRIKVTPLQGRSFHFKPVTSDGDSTKGFIVGEYTVELKNEEGMTRITTV